MLETVGLFPVDPVMRPRMLDVGTPELFRKFAILFVGTLKSPKLWKRFVPPPGLVPPVILYCVCPLGRMTAGPTCVFRPEPVMGEAAGTREVSQTSNTKSEQPMTRRGISRMMARSPR